MVHMSDNNNMDDNDFDLDNDAFDDIDDAAFDDFDDTQKGSLKEIWQNNPMLKLGVVVLGLVVIGVAVFLFGSGEENPTSVVKRTTDAKQLPSESELTPDMEKRIEEKNEYDYRLAEATGSSQIPISTELPQQGLNLEDQEKEPDVDDPLAEWRSQAIEKEVKEPTQPEEPEIVEPVEQPARNMQPPVLRPNPEAVAALRQGFSAQMRQVLGDQGIGGPNHMQVTSSEAYFNSKNAANAAGGGAGNDGDNAANAAGEEVQTEVLVTAGDVVYAQTLTESNTDAPGPVLAHILSGPLKGSRILGGFTQTEEFLVISFDRVVYNDEVIGVDAVALDVDTTLPGVVTDINRRYFKRVILPAAAAFVEGFGSAIAESGSTTVTVEGETVTEETEDLDTQEELMKGVEEASSVIADFMEEEADRTKPMIKVRAGTPIGILFVDSVERPIE